MASGRSAYHAPSGFPRVFYLRYHGYRLFFPAAGAGPLSQPCCEGNARRVAFGF